MAARVTFDILIQFLLIASLLFSISNLYFDIYTVKVNEIKCETHSTLSILALEFMLYRESEIADWLHQFGSRISEFLTKRWHHEYGDKL